MKIIYDDIIYSLQQSGGISVYWNNLEDYIPVDKRIVYDGVDKNIFYEKRENSVFCTAPVSLSRYKNVKVNESAAFIFHSSYYRFCRSRFAINVTTVHDFTYEMYRTDWRSSIHKIQKRNAVKHSDGVICISENTKKDLLKYYPDFSGRIKVVYHGYDSIIFRNTNVADRTRNVLFVGSRTSYKNFFLTIQLISCFKELNLLIIGGGNLLAHELEMLDKFLPARYEKLDFVSNEELAALYNESFALAYPSDYEGFGFPVIEAQACGCPVICQPVSSIPEVSGGSCIYINKNDVASSEGSISRLFDKSHYKEIQISGLENAKRFSWKKAAEETLFFYQELYENKISKQ